MRKKYHARATRKLQMGKNTVIFRFEISQPTEREREKKATTSKTRG